MAWRRQDPALRATGSLAGGFFPERQGSRLQSFIAAAVDWLSAHADLTRATRLSAAVQLVLIAAGLVLAILLRRLTRERAAQLVDHADPRLRDPRLIYATRSLALPLLWGRRSSLLSSR
jgi:hypothetical protein